MSVTTRDLTTPADGHWVGIVRVMYLPPVLIWWVRKRPITYPWIRLQPIPMDIKPVTHLLFWGRKEELVLMEDQRLYLIAGLAGPSLR